MNRAVATGILIVTALVWGLAFIPQKTAMDVMGPLSFMAARYILGGLAILPLVLWERRRNRTFLTSRDWQVLALMVFAMLAGSWLQQVGLIHTTATNSGFLTGLYVIFVPLILLAVLRRRPHPIVWIGAPLALLGIYLLNGGRFDGLNTGDAYIIACAVFWAVQVITLGMLAQRTGRPIFVSAVGFLAIGVISAGGALAFETVSLEAYRLGWIEVAYAAFFATAIGFTFQAIAQQHVPPANAAIIMSAEALFAALAGALLLGERLSLIGYAGAALIFAAIVLVEAVPVWRRGAPDQSAEATRVKTVERQTTI